jgi:hypothetical protein
MVNRIPCMVKRIPRVVKRIPCMVKRIPCMVKRIPRVVKRIPCTVKRVPCMVKRVPCMVKRVPCTVKRVPCTVKRVSCMVDCTPFAIFGLPPTINARGRILEPRFVAFGRGFFIIASPHGESAARNQYFKERFSRREGRVAGGGGRFCIIVVPFPVFDTCLLHVQGGLKVNGRPVFVIKRDLPGF